MGDNGWQFKVIFLRCLVSLSHYLIQSIFLQLNTMAILSRYFVFEMDGFFRKSARFFESTLLDGFMTDLWLVLQL